MKKIFTVFCITAYTINSFSQLSIDETNKYWNYRYNLVNKFTIVGEEEEFECNVIDKCSGHSIPASRNYCAIDGVYPGIKWGDATINLGWYIAVLATEYKLLEKYGRNTDRTLQELYYAMKAYERLDKKAEAQAYPGSSTCILNGLFIRDDVYLNPSLNENTFYNRNYFEEFKIHSNEKFSYNSDFKDHNIISKDDDPNINFYPSPDQIAYLFVGFALVKKCLGDAEYNGYDFVENAQFYTHLIANRLNNNNWEGLL